MMSGQPTHPGWIWVTGWLKHTGTVSKVVNNERAAYTSWIYPEGFGKQEGLNTQVQVQ